MEPDWEYKYGHFSDKQLNALGKEGWEGFKTHVEHIQDEGERKEVIIYHFRRKIHATI